MPNVCWRAKVAGGQLGPLDIQVKRGVSYRLNDINQTNMPGIYRGASSGRGAHQTVGTYAHDLHKTADALIAQLREAGIKKTSADDALSEDEKQQLLEHLQLMHGTATSERKRIRVVKGAASDGKKRPSPRGRVVLVGGLGEFDYAKAGDRGQGLLDRYEQYIRAFYARLAAHTLIEHAPDLSFQEICRRLTRTLKGLRRSSVRAPLCRQRTRVRLARGLARHGGAFFHILKVDGRNLP